MKPFNLSNNGELTCKSINALNLQSAMSSFAINRAVLTWAVLDFSSTRHMTFSWHFLCLMTSTAIAWSFPNWWRSKVEHWKLVAPCTKAWDGLAELPYASKHVLHFIWFSVDTYTNNANCSSHFEEKTFLGSQTLQRIFLRRSFLSSRWSLPWFPCWRLKKVI